MILGIYLILIGAFLLAVAATLDVILLETAGNHRHSNTANGYRPTTHNRTYLARYQYHGRRSTNSMTEIIWT